MKWTVYTNMNDFWKKSQTYFFENESRYVKILSYFLEKESDDLEDHFAWLLESDTEIKAFAMLFPNGSLHCGEFLEPDIYLNDLLQSIQTSNVQIEAVVAPTSIVQRFLDALTGDFELEMNQHIMECTDIILPEDKGGELVQAKEEHRDTVRSMLIGFFDCFPNPERQMVHLDRLLGYIEQNKIYLWRNSEGVFVSMAAIVRKNRRSSSVSLVYTFDRYRGNGYGSQVTAYLTKLLLEGERPICNLFTDATNPTSNFIYQKMGYKIIGSHSRYQRPTNE